MAAATRLTAAASAHAVRTVALDGRRFLGTAVSDA
jgi:hypothetical protein